MSARSAQLRKVLAEIEVGSSSPNMLMVVAVSLIVGAVLFFAITKFVPSLTNPESSLKLSIPGLVIILIGMGIGGKLAYDNL